MPRTLSRPLKNSPNSHEIGTTASTAPAHTQAACVARMYGDPEYGRRRSCHPPAPVPNITAPAATGQHKPAANIRNILRAAAPPSPAGTTEQRKKGKNLLPRLLGVSHHALVPPPIDAFTIQKRSLHPQDQTTLTSGPAQHIKAFQHVSLRHGPPLLAAAAFFIWRLCRRLPPSLSAAAVAFFFFPPSAAPVPAPSSSTCHERPGDGECAETVRGRCSGRLSERESGGKKP